MDKNPGELHGSPWTNLGKPGKQYCGKIRNIWAKWKRVENLGNSEAYDLK
jgi:hypothetical protein